CEGLASASNCAGVAPVSNDAPEARSVEPRKSRRVMELSMGTGKASEDYSGWSVVCPRLSQNGNGYLLLRTCVCQSVAEYLRPMDVVSEDVASGYWTPSVKWSSGLISHYGSTPSSSARLLDRILLYNNLFDRWRTHWLAALPDERGFCFFLQMKTGCPTLPAFCAGGA